MCRHRRIALLFCILAAVGAIAKTHAAGVDSAGAGQAQTELAAPGGGLLLFLGTYSGVSFGTAKELVYYTDAASGLDHYKVSELDWPLQAALYLGTRIDLETPWGLRATVDLKAGLPTRVGVMTDTDYLNFDGTPTNFSQSTAELERLVAVRADLGWSFLRAGDFSMTAFTRYSFLDLKWSANDGYYQYPPGFSSSSSPPYPPYTQDAQVPLYGLVALYEQRYSIPAVGLSGTYRFLGGAAAIEGSFAFSPLVTVHDIDNHVLRNLIFYDTVPFCTYMEPALRVSFRPAKRFEITLGLSYLVVLSPKNGSTISENTTNGTTTSYAASTAGASIQSVNATLGASVQL